MKAMRSARAVWDGCGDDERWIQLPEAMVEQILREGFATGFAAGVGLAAEAMEEHAARLAANFVLRLPASVPAGLKQTANVMREAGNDQVTTERAWLQAKGNALAHEPRAKQAET